MAKKLPYGNPLSTGIALNWKVDMTPWREEQKLQRAEEAARKAAQAKIKKEQAELMKGITFDPSKVLERDRDQALSLYASTISDAMKLSSQGDVGGTQMRILQFNRDMAPLLDGKANYDTYFDSDAAKTFKDEQMLRDFNDLSISREELLEKYPDISLQNGAWQLPVYDRIDVDAMANKLLQNTEKRTVRDEKGNPIIAGRNPLTEEIEYQEVINDPEGFMNNFTASFLEYGPSAQKQVMNYFKGTDLEFGPDQFDQLDEDGTQLLAKRTNQYLNEKTGEKLIGYRTKSKPQPRTTYDFGFGRTGLGDVQFGSVESSDVVSEYSTPEQKIDAVKNYYVGGISGLISESVKQQDQDAENYFKDNLPSSISDAMGKHNLYVDWFADFDPSLIKIVDAGEKVVGEVNLQSGDAAQQFFDVIRKNVGDDKLIERSQDYEGIQLPETTRETTLTPTGKTFTAEIAGAKEPEATWKLKAGDTVYMVGDVTSQKVVLTNDLTLPEGKWQGATPYEDQAGKESIYYDVTFPVGYSEDKLARWFGGKNELSSFKEANKDALPVTMLIPENQSTLSTLESVLSTKEVRKALAKGDNETAKKLQSGNLSGLMREYMELPSTARTTSGASTTSTGANLPSFPINNP